MTLRSVTLDEDDFVVAAMMVGVGFNLLMAAEERGRGNDASALQAITRAQEHEMICRSLVPDFDSNLARLRRILAAFEPSVARSAP